MDMFIAYPDELTDKELMNNIYYGWETQPNLFPENVLSNLEKTYRKFNYKMLLTGWDKLLAWIKRVQFNLASNAFYYT